MKQSKSLSPFLCFALIGSSHLTHSVGPVCIPLHITISSFPRNYLIMPFCQKFAPDDNPPILIFQFLTLSQYYSIHKKERKKAKKNEMRRSSVLMYIFFLWKSALPLIYSSFECCDTSIPLYSAKLTVHFIHNNHHHCRHFDLDMSWNPISKWILLMDYYTPLLCFLRSTPIWQIQFRVSPPFASPWKFTQAYMLGFD